MLTKLVQISQLTLGKAVTRTFAAGGVQNKFDKIIFSSSTWCSFRTAMALITVFPVPEAKKKNSIENPQQNSLIFVDTPNNILWSCVYPNNFLY